VWGHVTEGNQRDSPEPRFHITQLRQHLPDVGEPLWGADSQCLAGESVALAAAPRFRLVTMVPQTVPVRPAVVAAPALASLPPLGDQPGRRKGEREAEHGASVVRLYRWKTAAGEGQEWPLRFLVVESPHRAQAKAPRLATAQQVERAMLADLEPQWPRRTGACEADAHQAASLCLRERRLHDHHLT
jgi:hypothetical protein